MYWTIEQWMVTELHLNGSELHVFAIIYGYSRNGAGTFFGSRAKLAEQVGVEVRSIGRILARLEAAGYIEKSTGFHAGTQCYDWTARVHEGQNVPGTKCPTYQGQNVPPTGDKMSSPFNNTPIDNKDYKEGDTETRVRAVPADPARFVNLCPFGEEEIKELWGILLQQPKWRKKGANAIQQAAKMLGNVTAKTAFYMLQACIAGEWQGLHYPRPDELRTIESESFAREIEAARARIAARKAREAAERSGEGAAL